MRRLLYSGLVIVLLLSGWHGVLAAALCPHVQCQAASSVKGQPSSQAPTQQHESHCSDASEEMSEEKQSPPPQVAADDSEVNAEVADSSSGSIHQPVSFPCAHCMGSPQAPTTPKNERTAGQQNVNSVTEAPRVIGRVTPPLVSFVKEIIPYEDGPPHRVQRHVLIQVFLI